MLIGIDFDNTIICYDAVFHAVALERGLIPADLPRSKQAVRDHLRAGGREDEWTQMQGDVYGCRLDDAAPFPGVKEAIRTLRRAGHDVAIVSHKTAQPYQGPAYDLHGAAATWLTKQSIAGTENALIDPSHVHFEPTKEKKLARIAALCCDHFIDDLPEFLAEPAFPTGTQRWLFDPADAHADRAAMRRFQRWRDFVRRITTEAAA